MHLNISVASRCLLLLSSTVNLVVEGGPSQDVVLCLLAGFVCILGCMGMNEYAFLTEWLCCSIPLAPGLSVFVISYSHVSCDLIQ